MQEYDRALITRSASGDARASSDSSGGVLHLYRKRYRASALYLAAAVVKIGSADDESRSRVPTADCEPHIRIQQGRGCFVGRKRDRGKGSRRKCFLATSSWPR